MRNILFVAHQAGLLYESRRTALGRSAFRRELRQRLREFAIPGKIKRLEFQSRDLDTRTVGSFGDDFTRAIDKQIHHLAIIYFTRGRAAAITFVKSELLPAVLAPHVMEEALQVRMACDGLAREE